MSTNLPEPMRKAMYSACLAGAVNVIESLRLAPLDAKRAATNGATAKRLGAAKHDLHRALALLKIVQGGTQEIVTQILHSEAEATAIAVISMAADGLDPNRPTPHDWALQGAVQSLHAYVASQVGQDASAGK